jgi:hypothetical protein
MRNPVTQDAILADEALATDLVTIKATVPADLFLGDERVIYNGDTAEVPDYVADDLVAQGKAVLV